MICKYFDLGGQTAGMFTVVSIEEHHGVFPQSTEFNFTSFMYMN